MTDYQPYTLEVLLLTGRLLFYGKGGLEEFRPLTVVVFFTHAFRFLHPREERVGSSVCLLLCSLHDYTSALISLEYEEWILLKP